jgi:ASC-1-like (ASCH) protein
MNKTHEIKLDKEYFDSVLCGDKTFEIRHNDRGYQKGDKVIMSEHSHTDYCTRKLTATISYVTAFQQPQNQVVFSLINVKNHNT